MIFFLIFEQVKIFPYYLDYYNQFVGGTSGAIRKGYDFSWWGEGQREAGLWVNQNAPDGSSVGLIVSPRYVFPRIRLGLNFKSWVDEKRFDDYPDSARKSDKSFTIFIFERPKKGTDK